jgi:hypothetical protein
VSALDLDTSEERTEVADKLGGAIDLVQGDAVELEQIWKITEADMLISNEGLTISSTVCAEIGYNCGSRLPKKTNDPKHEDSSAEYVEPDTQSVTGWEASLEMTLHENLGVEPGSYDLKVIATKIAELMVRECFEGGTALLTQAQVGRFLGVTRQRAQQLLRHEKAPEPLLTIEANKPLWFIPDVQAWEGRRRNQK